MNSYQSTIFAILVVALLGEQCFSFTLKCQPSRLSCGASRIPPFPRTDLVGQNKNGCRSLSMVTEESKDAEESGGEATEKVDALIVDDDDDETEGKRGITKTVLLAVPLFCKFVVILLLKFVTDLVVYPLLFLYRLAGTAKRKIMKKFSNEKFDKVNGEKQ